MEELKKAKIVYGYSRKQNNKIEYSVYTNKEERDNVPKEFLKGCSKFSAQIKDVFGQKNVLCIEYDSGKEVFITDPKIIKSFI